MDNAILIGVLLIVLVILLGVACCAWGRPAEIRENRERGCRCEQKTFWVAPEKDCPVHGHMVDE